MRFIHTSDWQIGKTFRLVDDETLAVLRAERLEVISRIGQLAQNHGADAVLVAGDVFDVTGVSLTTLLQPIERMRQYTGIEWHLIPGNHDVHGTDGPWERLLRTSVPGNVKLHTSPEPHPITGTSAWVLPAILTQRHSLADTTLPMDSMSTPEGALRIGLAHGSVRSFGSTDASTNNLLAIDRASKANLAYLALGDWHGSVQINERTWYSGTPEPDGFAKGRDGGGSVLLVDLNEDARGEHAPVVTPLATGKFMWREENETLHQALDISALEAKIRSLDPDLSRVLLRLEVNGALDLPGRERFEATIRTGLGSALRTLILNDTGLLVQPTAADIESIDHMGFVRVAADRLVEAGVWLSRKQRRSFHQPRLRRESYGELIQIDGSEHRWFEDRGEPCTLLVFIDDATSSLMQLRFVPSESTGTYFEALQGYLATHGCPVAFYSDKHSVFRINREAQGGSGMTQFGRALAELNIEIICANSSQAKGRVERANRTLQDRLVKDLRLDNICDIDSGNAFLPRFLERFNERFALHAAKPENLHRPLTFKPDRVNDILCHREQRYVSEQLTMSYDRKQIILERNELSEGLGGKYVDLYEFPDGKLEVRSKGHSLPYRLFSKDQRVSHTAVIENKRLSHALRIVKAQQEVQREPKVQTNSEKLGYKKNPRQVYGPNYKPKSAPAPAVEMTG